MPLHLALAHVAHPSVELHSAVYDVLACGHGGLLGLHRGEDDVFAFGIAARDITRVDPGYVDLACHLDEGVSHDLSRHERSAECLALAGPVHGEVEGALGGGVRRHREADALGDEVPREGGEPHALTQDIALRHVHCVEGELGGVTAPPAHLLQGPGGGVTLRPRIEQGEGDARSTILGSAGAHGGHDHVGANTRGDVDLGPRDLPASIHAGSPGA